jgi:maleylacetoacetate isomerase
MILYDYWRSSAAYRVRIGLNLLGLGYQSVAVDLTKGEHRSAAHLARNPQGLVPALDVDGVMLTQSLAILEYLDEVHHGGFLPADAVGRARVRTLAYAIAMEVSPVCNLSVRTFAAQISGGAVTADDWVRYFMAPGLAAVEAMLGHGPYCHGDRVTLADICLVPQVYNARRIGLDMAAMPRIMAVMDALEALPAVAAAHPDLHRSQ